LLELNTSGLRKPINSIFPDKFIIKKSNELKIPFTFGDDSHNIQQVGYRLQLARQTLIDLGIYRSHSTKQITTNNSKIIREQISLI
jgi:histidinol-phosphatase (PHP family)